MSNPFTNLLDPEERKKVALGEYYNKINLSPIQQAQVNSEILAAKKFEKDTIDKIQKALENQEIEKLGLYTVQDQDLLREYYEQLEKVRQETEAKLNKKLQQVENYELQQMTATQDQVMKAETATLLNKRLEFQQQEKQREVLEKKEVEELEDWKNSSVQKAIRSPTQEAQMEKDLVQNANDSDLLEMLKQSSPSGKKHKVILLMTVDIGDGRLDTIKIHDDDEHVNLAKAFIQKHQLGPDVLEPLTEHIRQNVEALLARQSKNSVASSSRKNSLSSKVSSVAPSQNQSQADGFQVFANNVSQTKSVNSSINNEDVDSLFRGLSSGSTYRRENAGQPKIDERSKKLAQKRINPNKPVFVRLHELAELKKKRIEDERKITEEQRIDQIQGEKLGMSNLSKVFAQYRNKGKFDNYGEKLFEEAKEFMEKRRREIEIAKIIEEKKPELEATFKPEVSETAKNLHFDQDVVTRLFESLGKSMDHREKLTKAVIEEESKECTFHPELNRNSEKYIREKERLRKLQNAEHFDLLHMEAKIRQNKRNEDHDKLPEGATFHPKIAKTSVQIVKEKKGHEDVNEFLNRMVNSKEETKKHIEQLAAQIHSNRDPETGKPYFQPSVSNNIKIKRDKPIYEELFKSSKELTQVKQQLAEEYNSKLKDLSKTVKVNSATNAVVKDMVEKKLNKLFDFFDDDADGYIYIRQMDLSQLEPELANQVSVIMGDFMNDHKPLITREEFISSMKERVEKSKNSGPPLISALASFSKKKITRANAPAAATIDPSFCTFKPRVSKTSQDIATKNVKRYTEDNEYYSGGENESKESYFETLSREKQLWNEKLNRLRQEKVDKELEQCTFHPNLVTDTSNATSKLSVLFNSNQTNGSVKQTNTFQLSPQTIEKLTNRLLQNRKPATNNEKLTSEDKEVQDHCTFSPKLRVKTSTQFLTSSPRTLRTLSPNIAIPQQDSYADKKKRPGSTHKSISSPPKSVTVNHQPSFDKSGISFSKVTFGTQEAFNFVHSDFQPTSPKEFE